MKQITLITFGTNAATQGGLASAINALGNVYEYNGIWFLFGNQISAQDLMTKLGSHLTAGLTPVIVSFDATSAVLPEQVRNYFAQHKAA